MPGFTISTYAKSAPLENILPTNYINNDLIYDSTICQRSTLNKFLDDKAFFQDDSYICISEGAILNKKNLFSQYNVNSVFDLFKKMYAQDGEAFFSSFRGSFSGALFDKNKKRWIIYTNHYGDGFVFYFYRDRNFVFASQMNYIIDILKTNNITFSLHEGALYNLLTYGYMPDEFTCVSGIKRLLPGQYAVIEENEFTVKTYWQLKKNKYDLSNKSEVEIIDEMDSLFREAVKLEYEKDKEYGFHHLSSLSGGLDSRMTTWVAYSLGYTDIVNINYCQSNNPDELIAKKIACSLGTDFLSMPMDSAHCMLDVAINMQMSQGCIWYNSITGWRRLLENLNLNKFGLNHTGQMGDSVVGSDMSSFTDLYREGLQLSYSKFFASKISGNWKDKYSDRELYIFHCENFMGMLGAHSIIRNYVDVSSPFLNIEFMEYCMSIPLQYRIKHKIYFKWMQTKYPQAAAFAWEKTGFPIYTSSYFFILLNGLSFLKRAIAFSIRKLNSCTGWKLYINKKSMNPMDLWYNDNHNISKFFDDFFANKINNSAISDNVRSDLRDMFFNGSVIDKQLVLSVLALVDIFFNKNEQEA